MSSYPRLALTSCPPSPPFIYLSLPFMKQAIHISSQHIIYRTAIHHIQQSYYQFSRSTINPANLPYIQQVQLNSGMLPLHWSDKHNQHTQQDSLPRSQLYYHIFSYSSKSFDSQPSISTVTTPSTQLERGGVNRYLSHQLKTIA